MGPFVLDAEWAAHGATGLPTGLRAAWCVQEGGLTQCIWRSPRRSCMQAELQRLQEGKPARRAGSRRGSRLNAAASRGSRASCPADLAPTRDRTARSGFLVKTFRSRRRPGVDACWCLPFRRRTDVERGEGGNALFPLVRFFFGSGR